MLVSTIPIVSHVANKRIVKKCVFAYITFARGSERHRSFHEDNVFTITI